MIDRPASAAAPRLRFTVRGADPLRSAAVPTLRLRLAVETDEEREIRGLGLNVRVSIAAERRRYRPRESERLGELFGPVDLWSRSLGSLLWTQTALNVAAFTRATEIDLSLPCTYDFEVVAAKYLAALEDGEIPIEVLFTGNVFYAGADGRLQIAMIPWDSEASLRLPVSVWRAAVDAAFPESGWVRVRRDLLARLQAYRSRRGLTGWDETLAALLAESEA
jgi:hypothetical protein